MEKQVKKESERDLLKLLTNEMQHIAISAAVVFTPHGKPMFREIAYTRHPQCKINETNTKVETWRFQTPYLYRQLSKEQRRKEQGTRETVHGLRYTADEEEKTFCYQQFELYELVKKAWKQNCIGKNKTTVVYYQQEVGDLLDILEIPCIHVRELFPDGQGAAYNPHKDISLSMKLAGTCGLPHEYCCPCQADLAMRLSRFVWTATRKEQQNASKEDKKESLGGSGGLDTQHDKA